MRSVFCMQININIFYKMILPFSVGVVMHVQITNQMAEFFEMQYHKKGLINCLTFQMYKGLRKGFQKIFLVQVSVPEHAQSTQHNKTVIFQEQYVQLSGFFGCIQTFEKTLYLCHGFKRVFSGMCPKYPKKATLQYLMNGIKLYCWIILIFLWTFP